MNGFAPVVNGNGNGRHTNGNGHHNGNGIVRDIESETKAATRLVKDLQQRYDGEFMVTPIYKDSLPDMQNTDDNRGSNVAIQHVGIHNFKPFSTHFSHCLPLTSNGTLPISLNFPQNKKIR